MDERKKRVLAAIVQDYVATAEPVGSRTIARKYNLGVSPATIRNEMADLEEMGLIEQPHTSAGRIPSDKGYRYFVDCLMEKYALGRDDEEYIRQSFTRKMQEIETVIQQSAATLSQMTNYAAVALGPQVGKSIYRIQFLHLEPGKALLVVVTDAKVVEHRLMEIPLSITSMDLERISEVLNSRLHGVSMERIQRETLADIYRELHRQRQLVGAVLDVVEELFRSNQENRVFLGGMLNILNQPEFRDVSRVKNLLSILEQGNVIRELMQEQPSGLAVRIGGENRHEGFADCSLVTATYHLDGEVVGMVGIIGPTRMDYARALSLVDYISVHLSDFLAKMIK